jgi:hypothetical protein
MDVSTSASVAEFDHCHLLQFQPASAGHLALKARRDNGNARRLEEASGGATEPASVEPAYS